MPSYDESLRLAVSFDGRMPCMKASRVTFTAIRCGLNRQESIEALGEMYKMVLKSSNISLLCLDNTYPSLRLTTLKLRPIASRFESETLQISR